MLIGHLTDLHIVEDGQKLGGVLDVNALAARAVETINAGPVKPAFVVVTGDLTHGGSIAEMKLARTVLDRLDVPYFAMPGGHDATSAFDEAFGDRGWRDRESGDFRYIVDDFAVRLVVADTTGGKGAKPRFGSERCTWLDETLGAAPDAPTLLAIHHPPFQCRIPVAAYVEDPDVLWAGELKHVVTRHPQIKTICCGHVHRTTHALWGGTMVSIGPGASVQAEPVFGDMSGRIHDAPRAGLVTEPGGWQAFWWDGESLVNFGLLTDRSYARY